jgi:hypothetical protein
VSPYVNHLQFRAAIEVANKALALLRDHGVELRSGHVLGGSITFAIDFSDFGRLVASGSLRDVTFDRAAATDEISHHATIHHQAVLASYPDVRVLAVAIQRLPPAAEPDTWPVPFGS